MNNASTKKQKTAKNGNGHIRLRNDNRWEGQYYYEGERRSIYGSDYDIVRTQLNEILAKISRNTYVDGSKMNLADYLNFWLTTYVKVKPSTRTSYDGYINNHIRAHKIGKKSLKTLEFMDFQNFFNQKQVSGRLDGKKGGLSPKTLKNIKNMLHEALNLAVYPLQYIAMNPLTSIRLPKVINKEARFFNRNEQNVIEKAILEYPDPNAAIILLDLYTGLRLGELLGIKKRDFSFDLSYFDITRTLSRQYVKNVKPEDGYELVIINSKNKTKTALYTGPVKTEKGRRRIYTNETARQAIMRVLGHLESTGLSHPQDFIFLNSKAEPFDPRTYSDLYKRVLGSAGIKDATFHALRHTFASRGIELGIDIKTLQEILGHAQASTTLNMYGHCREDQKISAMNRFDCPAAI